MAFDEVVVDRHRPVFEVVAQAATSGGLDREIQVEVNPGLMEAYGLDLGDVAVTSSMPTTRPSTRP